MRSSEGYSFPASDAGARLDSFLGMFGVGTVRTVNGYTIATTDVVPHNINASGGVVELNLPTSAAWSAANPDIPFIRINAVNIANAATVDPNGSEFINGLCRVSRAAPGPAPAGSEGPQNSTRRLAMQFGGSFGNFVLTLFIVTLRRSFHGIDRRVRI